MDLTSITTLMDGYAILIVPLVLGLTALVKNFLPEASAGKWSPLISLVIGVGAMLLVAGVSRQSAVIGVLLGLSASGLFSGIKSAAAKTGSGGYIRIRQLFILCIFCLLLAVALGCASMGPEVPLTPEQQARVDVQAYENVFMTFYREAHQYVLDNPQYKEKWNTNIQPAFSDAHAALALHEKKMLEGEVTAVEVKVLLDKSIADLIVILRQIGWVKKTNCLACHTQEVSYAY